MKSVALAVLFVGYVFVVYGVNHVRSGCVSFKDTVWPSGGSVTDPCGGNNTGGGANNLGASATSAGNAATSAAAALSSIPPVSTNIAQNNRATGEKRGFSFGHGG